MRRFRSAYISLTAWGVSQISAQMTGLLLTSIHLHATQRRIAVCSLWSGLSSAIIVMLTVFTWTLHWTEIVHMSRMIHLVARAHNPLHIWWIIYVAVHVAELTQFVSSLWCFHLLSPNRYNGRLTHMTTEHTIWNNPVAQTLLINMSSSQSSLRDSSLTAKCRSH